jgi:hypothetical protein
MRCTVLRSQLNRKGRFNGIKIERGENAGITNNAGITTNTEILE